MSEINGNQDMSEPTKKGLDSKKFIAFFKYIFFFSVVVGYPLLLSYTWPLSFVPVVSLGSLPILLLGFLVLLLFLWVFAVLLWLPVDKFYHDKKLSSLIFGAGNEKAMDKLYFGVWVIPIIVVWIFAILIFKVSFFILVVMFVVIAFLEKHLGEGSLTDSFRNPVFVAVLIFVLFFACLAYFLAYSIFGSGLEYSVWLIALGIVYFWFYMMVLKGTNIDQKVAISIVVWLMLIFLPTFIPTVIDSGNKRVPNVLVGGALRLVHLGGGIPVEIIYSPTGNLIVGNLFFYDGHKAWLRECKVEGHEESRMSVGNMNGAESQNNIKKMQSEKVENFNDNSRDDVIVTEVVVQKISFLNHKACP